MRKRLYMDELHLSKSKKLPGPGQYQHPDVVSANPISSKQANSMKYSMGKAEDRFATSKFSVPGAGTYAPSDSLNNNVMSSRQNFGSTRIGNDKLTFVDTEWKIKDKKEGPGPGAYARFSDFQGLEIVKSVP
jgi:hypothetical protein